MNWHGVQIPALSQFSVERLFLRRADGMIRAIGLIGKKSRRDSSSDTNSRSWDWGQVSLSHALSENRINVQVKVENRSDQTIESIQLHLGDIQLPESAEPQNIFFRTPWMREANAMRMSHGIGEPGIVGVDFPAGSLAVCNEQVSRPLGLGFGWPKDTEKRSWPLLLYTGRHPSVPKMFPYIKRPILPGQSDTFSFSIRFGPSGADLGELTDDLFKRFAQAHPFQVHWADRRPIGQIFLCRSHSGWETNPRGYFNTPDVDIKTEAGLIDFKKRLLTYADGCVRIMKDMNAQGVIVWDVEGQENKHPISYLGDPRSLPPEMEPVADEFFKKFTDASLKVGVTIRPQIPVRRPYSNEVFQQPAADPARNMIEKITYARKRWGCTIFYLDSDVYVEEDPKLPGIEATQSLLLGSAQLRQVAEAHPDVLVIPEVEDLQNYAYGAPYLQLNYDKLAATPPEVLRAYPNAFGVIVIVDSQIEGVREQVVQAVRRGDILFYRTWFGDSWNKTIKAIYDKAKP
ncbi:MAG: hypothetical protein O3B01_10880 [Planctomycetota bacterium]|nr:hypothetical protein [Planctomycetota bacterium]MDA1139075.1 hypothetical protein [Planctomycetota bacterium]